MTKFLVNCFLLLLISASECKNLLDELKINPKFSKFVELVQQSKFLEITLTSREITAFVPTNEAFEKYDGPTEKELVQYHLSNLAHKIQDVDDVINTELAGNPVVYVTKLPSGRPSLTGWENFDYYINNAKVASANHLLTSDEGDTQYYHEVDEVIRPTITEIKDKQAAKKFREPDALMVIESSSEFGFKDDFDMRDFYNRVKDLKVTDIFEREGKNTFFVPIQNAIKQLKPEQIFDQAVVSGHVVPGEVLFERAVRDFQKQYKSLAHGSELKVYISLENVTNTETGELNYYVKSNIVRSDPKHKKGSALARIVKGNIPVKNGVVHLIDRPLMVVAPTIVSYLQEKEGQLSKFNNLLVEHHSDLHNYLTVTKTLTLFAPSNKAFELVNIDQLNKMIANHERLKQILKMHVVNRIITTDEIIEKSKNEIFQVESMTPNRQLYFAAHDLDKVVPTLYIEGGGVNATITTANIATNNGVIHIIDHMFGIPSNTVFEKLASDPKLSKTFALAKQGGWGNLLDDRSKKFTFFAPSNKAWDYIRREMPSPYKKMFSGRFHSMVKNILQRHLIANQQLFLEELEQLTTNSTPSAVRGARRTQLQMTREKIFFEARVKSAHGEFFLEWYGKAARVVRPDVECVNGVVHVIDSVLMAERDSSINGAHNLPRSEAVALSTAILTLLLARAFV